MININGRKNLLGWLILLIMLVSCSQGAGPPIEVEIVSIEPEPIVGQVSTVTFTIEGAAPNQDIPSTVITPYLSKTRLVQPAEADSIWEGTLLAEEPLELSWTFCITEPGRWNVLISAGSTEEPFKAYGGMDIWYIESDFDHAEVTSHYEGSTEAEVIVGTVVVQGNNSTPIPSEIEDVTDTKATVEQTVYSSQECLEANSQP